MLCVHCTFIACFGLSQARIFRTWRDDLILKAKVDHSSLRLVTEVKKVDVGYLIAEAMGVSQLKIPLKETSQPLGMKDITHVD